MWSKFKLLAADYQDLTILRFVECFFTALHVECSELNKIEINKTDWKQIGALPITLSAHIADKYWWLGNTQYFRLSLKSWRCMLVRSLRIQNSCVSPTMYWRGEVITLILVGAENILSWIFQFFKVLKWNIDQYFIVFRVHLDEENFTLFVDQQSKKIAVVHLDFGFLPEHYVNEEVWKLRLDMERSTAIISPNIRLQLSGTKKI